MDFLQILERFGFPTAILLLVVVAVYYFFKAVWRDIVIPLRDRVLGKLDAFFERAIRVFDRIEEHNAAAVRTADRLQARLDERMDDLEDAIEEVDQRCVTIMDKLKLNPTASRHRRERPQPLPPPTEGPHLGVSPLSAQPPSSQPR